METLLQVYLASYVLERARWNWILRLWYDLSLEQ